MTFSQPAAGGDTFDPKEFNGRLLLIYPKQYDGNMQTAHGVSASADVDIIVVDFPDPQTGQPKFFSNARLFGNLAKSVSRDMGGQVLGRLGQGPNTRGTPPWILTNFTDQDAAVAAPLHAQYQQGLFKPAENPMNQQQQQPPQQFQPPAQQQYQAPPPQQQYQPAPAPQQQYQAPPQQQYAPAPAGPPAAPAPAPAPVGAADPALLARLAQHGINLPPTTPQDQALAIAATLPQ